MSNIYCRFQFRKCKLAASLFFLSLFYLWTSLAAATINQTDTTTPILCGDVLPFTLSIEKMHYKLPVGLHSGASAAYKDKWVIIAGRTNGLHGFAEDPFPPSQQNKVAFVIDLKNQTTYSRSLEDGSSRLNQQQIDELSVTSPQSFQVGKTLYICGGYGIDTASQQFNTKQTFTAIDLPKFIKWVKKGKGSAAAAIRQTANPWMQVAGGYMAIVNKQLEGLLVFGQNFDGVYTPNSNGNYTMQVRRFQIIDDEHRLAIRPLKSESPKSYYRRRDLNVVPVIDDKKPAYVALSGVFTLKGGIWTVPVWISNEGCTQMPNPNKQATFKQGMNNYVSATAQLYAMTTKENFIIQLGGLSFGYFENGLFITDNEIPFINQVTTVKIDKRRRFSQYLMSAEYPLIPSKGTNPGNPLLFGAGAYYFDNKKVPQVANDIVDLDKIKRSTVIGYIVGGIMSTLPNTVTIFDSTASPYIFRVNLTPKK